tara:strand:- start:1202 stop:2245 length:1044 start_codon:yes stop_codon:yes gene_type:complete
MNNTYNKDFDKYKDNGLTGLANVGNTCYLNSCIQILSHTYEFNDYLNTKKYKTTINDITDSLLLVEWDKLRELMWSENCTIAPYGFIKSVQKVAIIKELYIFSGNAQNDIHEFLIFLIDSFHNSLSREVDMKITGIKQNKKDKLAEECYNMIKSMYNKEYSEILELFNGIHISEITSFDNSKRLSIRPEPYSILHLSINDKTKTLYDCIEEYCLKEDLTGENGWIDENTNKKQDVKKGIIFWSFPEILIIALKRWNKQGRKVHDLIDIPIDNFNLSKFVNGYNPHLYIYDLYGVCNHSGGTQGGHYTSNVKNANNKWYNYNDTIINEITDSEIITTKSYCLFYRKKK